MSEPQLMPARLPFVLLNGASGIAVGMATEIPPHNLREVARGGEAADPEAGGDAGRSAAPAAGTGLPRRRPDHLPAAGIRDAYATGRGSLRMRARWRIEDLARGQWRVIVEELPHGVSMRGGAVRDRGRHQPAAARRQEGRLAGAEEPQAGDARRARFRARRIQRQGAGAHRAGAAHLAMSQEEFMAVLLAHTSLETSVSVNMTMIGRDGRPQQKPLLPIAARVDRVPPRHRRAAQRAIAWAKSSAACTSSKAA